MGNHEYCSKCGEDDFHRGRSCDPVKLAEQAAWKARIDRRSEFRKELTAVLAAAIDKAGIPVKISYQGDITINLFPILDLEEEYEVYLRRAKRLEYKA